MVSSLAVAALAALPAIHAQFVPPPAPVLLNSTKSGVLPVLPTPFNGTLTLEGAIISKAPINASYTPVLGPASVQSNLPAATYMATLPSVAFDALTGTTISGSVVGSTQQGATGVTFTFNLTNFPNVTQYGSFAYHIHDMPVPADGNCTSTLGHFDTTNAGEYYTCNRFGGPQNCQTGDLAGKHGRINGTSFNASFVELYLSTDPSSAYFFGSKSIVFHTANTTRLTCANFMLAPNGSVVVPPPTTTTNTTRPTVSMVTTNAAARSGLVGTASLAAALFFAVLLV